MGERFPIYVFRGGQVPARKSTLVSAAPFDLVVSVYGGDGFDHEGGLAAAFGGAALFRNEETGLAYLAVWGARNASRFRSALRQGGAVLDIVYEPPPAPLVRAQSRGTRPPRESK